MWTIVGPFDGSVANETDFSKHKLLKPGKSYTMGRGGRGHPLTINSKKVSKIVCEVLVGEYTVDNLSNPKFIPTIEVHNRTDAKVLKVTRKGDQLPINAGASLFLENGDYLGAATGVSVSFVWVPHCIYLEAPRRPSFSLDQLASLAFSLVQTPHPSATHHVTNEVAASATIGTSLLTSCHIVKPEWVEETLRRADLPFANPKSLENHFSLPQCLKYLPAFKDDVPKPLRTKERWEPNEARMHLFQDFRFLCVGEKSREVDNALRTMIERGEGTIETFNVQDGIMKWRKTLLRGSAKEGKKVAAVADVMAVQAVVGKAPWQEFVKEAAEFNVTFVQPRQLVECIIQVDVSPLGGGGVIDSNENSQANSLSTLETPPEVEEPAAPPIRRRLPRRAALAQPSQEPDIAMANPGAIDVIPKVELIEEEPAIQDPPRRRPLKRRAASVTQDDDDSAPTQSGSRRPLIRRARGGEPIITGIDDNSILVDESLATLPPPSPSETQSMQPPRSRRPLKRRRDTADDPLKEDAVQPTRPEPAYKKHRALYDSLDPEKLGITYDGTQFHGLDNLGSQGSQTQETGASSEGRLLTVHEEEEETQTMPTPVVSTSRGQKRKQIDDIEMEAVGAALYPSPSPAPSRMESAAPPSKRRAMETVNAIERLPTTVVQDGEMYPPPPPKPSKAVKPGAPPGKPDKDDAFLKALASTKRGKKNEDDFDREFNKLKISKPDMEKDDTQEQWNVLDDFGDDRNIRGNFMVVVTMDVREGGRTRKAAPPDPAWDGKANFKKFKRKDLVRTKSKPVELVISDETTLGDRNGNDMYGDDDVRDVKPPRRTQKAPTRTQSTMLSDSDKEEPVLTLAHARKGVAKAAPSQAAALFFDDPDEAPAEEDDDVQTLMSAPSAPPPKKVPKRAAASRQAAIMADDDDDDEEVVKPRATRTRRR